MAGIDTGTGPVLGPQKRVLGFWTCWSLTVGVMIGSGVFLLPAVLAPYGLMSFAGWMLTGAGSILLALVLGRLASRTRRTGGPYIFAHDAFGDLPGFLVAWGYWASLWIAVPAIAIAFVGYLTVFIPPLANSPMGQAGVALALIWTLTLVNIAGLKEAGLVQIAMTVLKLIPLFVIIGLGTVAGSPDNLPAPNPTGEPFIHVLAATALLTMWAFAGLEAGTLPAGSVKNPEKTIPRAVIIGTITVTLIYLAATAAVMMLVPAEILVESTSPFAEAARGLGSWGPHLIAIGALVSTAGSLNGNVFASGQIPMAVALDRLAPKVLARVTPGGGPYVALIAASTLGSIVLVLNYSRGLVGAFTFLLMMSTLAVLAPLFISVAAEIRHSWKSAKGWAALAALAGLYAAFAIFGSGLEVLAWGLVLVALGVPVFYWGSRSGTPAGA
ncbi:APC family permease [Hyphobacterium marinum]|uniref:Arginine/agmatine antiporter n=1 Tax=Hyphobacterium marinum TaxID=3116574 RepID=A0ABU7LW41_9PROT|nr:amino acid permease [Hyphobacterium sp. Y6023]MEE2565745.1 amino acid permease [Hyphobacterium sp. Y6023]